MHIVFTGKCLYDRPEEQIHVEFVWDLVVHLNCQCSLSEVNTFQDLSDLAAFGKFKNYVPVNVA